jgi:DNA-binding transcriptional MerR regulator
MTQSQTSERISLALFRVTGAGPTNYSLEAAAEQAGVHPEVLRYYCRLGLLGDSRARQGADPVFDDDDLYEVRRFERFRRDHGMSRRTVRLICDLSREVERLRAELRFRRGL